MNPMLPGALIEREKICEFCACTTAAWATVEMRGSMYVLCAECQYDHVEEIANALAKADADAQLEDWAQEGE